MTERTDSQLAHDIERALGQLPGVNVREFKVSVTNGVADVRGVVLSLAEKQAALEAARQIQGVQRVLEAIAVETPNPPRDAVLEQDLGEALEREPVNARKVGANAVRGQAGLTGTSRSLAELGQAVEVTESVPNNVNTYDSARIGNPYGPDRIALINAIADALRDHPVLRHRGIQAVLEDTGDVVLTGDVRSDEERREALRLTAAVDGVRNVREELSIVP